MVTITNQLDTCLVVPDGVCDHVALTLMPKETIRLKDLTKPIQDAEKKGMLKISYPTTVKSTKTKAVKKPKE